MRTASIQPHAGLYVHIPFCKQACHYCNFHFSTKLTLKSHVLKGILQELYLRKDYLQLPLTSIYFGGGTPSLLELKEVESLLQAIFQLFPIEKDIEITIEANPDDITLQKLLGWKKSGINRLSVGIQTFNDRVLQSLNRSHSSTMAQQSIAWAHAAGFENISLDLMYAIPGTTTIDWELDLEKAVMLAPTHISTYGLTIEPKTAMGYWHQQGRLFEVSEEVAASQFEYTIEYLSNKGYLSYEISSFCKSEKFSKHNINYWKSGYYLGVGPGAHSYNGLKRQWNISHNGHYIQSIQNGKIPYTEEVLTLENHVNEYIMMSLRTCWGCDLTLIHQKYKVDLQSIRKDYITQLITHEIAYLSKEVLHLTNKGKLMASKIAGDLFIHAPLATG